MSHQDQSQESNADNTSRIIFLDSRHAPITIVENEHMLSFSSVAIRGLTHEVRILKDEWRIEHYLTTSRDWYPKLSELTRLAIYSLFLKQLCDKPTIWANRRVLQEAAKVPDNENQALHAWARKASKIKYQGIEAILKVLYRKRFREALDHVTRVRRFLLDIDLIRQQSR